MGLFGRGGAKSHVQVTGLRELRRDLREIKDPTIRKEFLGGLKAAGKVIADEARQRVPSRSGRAAKSLRSGASWQRGSAQGFVIGGKKTVPYFGWLDFGSRSPKSGNARSVGPWAGSGAGPKDGRFIYPAIGAKEREVLRMVERSVDEALKKSRL